jgi:phosphate transport system permease protein
MADPVPSPIFGRVSLWRRVVNKGVMAATLLAALLVLAPLFLILGFLLIRGVGSLNWAFLSHTPVPVGETGGGMGNAIVGTFMILGVAALIGIPWGIAGGIYLSEYGRNGFGNLIRFTADVLNGVPSIVTGIAVYGLVVVTQKHFSALAGGIALGIMMIPIIVRATEEMLLMVPQTIREAALGLGVSQWRTTLSVTLRTASSGVITGIMLAFARVAGETAPLLFTAFGNQFWNLKFTQPTAALSLQVYNYAISPYDDWHRMAWAGALVLIVLIIGTISVVRVIASRGLLKGAA